MVNKALFRSLLVVALAAILPSCTYSFTMTPSSTFHAKLYQRQYHQPRQLLHSPFTVKPTASTTMTHLKALPLDLGAAWAAYNEALEANPLIVKSITACILLGMADLTGQILEQKQAERKENDASNNDSSKTEGLTIDWPRAIRFAFFGLVLQAPWNHYYYLILDGAIPPPEDPFTPINGVKVVIDQFVQAPIFTAIIFVFLGFLEGKKSEDISKQFKDDYKSTMIKNWQLWVPATLINFAVVPPILRVLYQNCVFFVWSIYLSLVLNKK